MALVVPSGRGCDHPPIRIGGSGPVTGWRPGEIASGAAVAVVREDRRQVQRCTVKLTLGMRRLVVLGFAVCHQRALNQTGTKDQKADRRGQLQSIGGNHTGQ